MLVGGGGGRPLETTGDHRGHFPHIDLGPFRKGKTSILIIHFELSPPDEIVIVLQK